MVSQRAKSILTLFGIATVCALFTRFVLIENFRISSDSMSPTLMTGDLVFVWKSAYGLRLPFTNYELVKFRKPTIGEIVAFSLPDQTAKTFVKRVAALEGETVKIHEGKLLVNNQVRADLGPEDKVKDYGPVDIPAGYFFALGDNRTDSIDSRSFGPIPNFCLKGVVSLIWMSINGHGGLRRDRIGIWPK